MDHHDYAGFKTDEIESLFSSPSDYHALVELKQCLFFNLPLQDSSYLLDKDPMDIPAADHRFLSNKGDLLICQNWPANQGIWKNCNKRSLGWGMAYMDGRTFDGLKRTFAFNRQRSGKLIKTNWFMDVYWIIDNKINVKNDMYLCQVKQADSSYNPRPDAHAINLKELKSKMAEIEACLLNDDETSTGIRHGKRPRSGAWDQFTKIETYNSQGEELKMSICNHCCMVYRCGTTNCSHGTKTLNKHSCKCRCNR